MRKGVRELLEYWWLSNFYLGGLTQVRSPCERVSSSVLEQFYIYIYGVYIYMECIYIYMEYIYIYIRMYMCVYIYISIKKLIWGWMAMGRQTTTCCVIPSILRHKQGPPLPVSWPFPGTASRGSCTHLTPFRWPVWPCSELQLTLQHVL